MSTKHTSGDWEPIYSHGVCIGVGAVEKMKFGNNTTMVLNSILPDTDQEYLKERDEIEANMKLCAAAPALLAALQRVKADPWYEDLSDGTCEAVEQAIKKAMS